MLASLKLEYFGANSEGWQGLAEVIDRFGGSTEGSPRNPGKPWVAEIAGVDSKFRFTRRFIPFRQDYSEANGVGSRGIYRYYLLESGKVYEVYAPTSWKAHDRYFCRVEEGRIVRMTEQMVMEFLAAHPPEPEPEKPKAPVEGLKAALGTKRGLGINVLQAAQERKIGRAHV